MKVWNYNGCNQKFPIMKIVNLQLFTVYHASIKILQLSNTFITILSTNSDWYLDVVVASDISSSR